VNKKEIYLSFILLALAFVILLVTLYPYRYFFRLNHHYLFSVGRKNIIKITPTITLAPTILK